MPRKKLLQTDYHVAWIAPLYDVEVLPSRLMLDMEHDTPEYDTNFDDNLYICGELAGHNVVIATCPPGMTGNLNASRVADPLFKTFSSIRMTVLVGIGGGVPIVPPPDDPIEDVHLGDVVVGWPGDGRPACIYYNSGKWHADGDFEMLGSITKPNRILLNALGRISQDSDVDQNTFHLHRERLLLSRHSKKFTFPGCHEDRLFRAAYAHAGVKGDQCVKCDISELVTRPARAEEDADRLVFHQGRIATGDALIRDGVRRDEIRTLCTDALCIEMEAAGVDVDRPCLVIRGISDYSDSHKNDIWRMYAAGNAAVFARELLCKIPPKKVVSSTTQVTPKTHLLVRFGRNQDFVGRKEILHMLDERLPPTAQPETCQRTVIEGLGGIGKTQVAIEAAYRVRNSHPECSIFWVHAMNMTMFENGYREIGRALAIEGMEDEKAGIKALVKEALSQTTTQWLLILDNVDATELVTTDGQVMSWLPFSLTGSILFTTRNHNVTARIDKCHQITLTELDETDSCQLLHQGLQQRQIGDPQDSTELLKFLAHLPLAIRQASAYMASNSDVTIAKYVGFCQSSDEDFLYLLSEDFNDVARVNGNPNPIARTLLISFEQIMKDKPLAAHYLLGICYLAEKNIPRAFFPPNQSERVKSEAISTLEAYAFLQRNAPDTGPHQSADIFLDTFNIHRLVRLVMRNWLREQGQELGYVTLMSLVVLSEFPEPTYTNQNLWRSSLLHAHAVLEWISALSNHKPLILLSIRVSACYELMGRYREAVEMYRQALELAQAPGNDQPMAVSIRRAIANLLKKEGKFLEAEQMSCDAWLYGAIASGSDHPDTNASMLDFAELLARRLAPGMSEDLCQQHPMLRIRGLGQEDPEDLAASEAPMVQELARQVGKFVGKCILQKSTLPEKLKELSREHPEALTSLKALVLRGIYTVAEQVWEKLSPWRIALSPEHMEALVSPDFLATILREQRDQLEGVQPSQVIWPPLDSEKSPEQPDSLTAMTSMAWILYRRGKYSEAEQICRKTLLLTETELGSEHPATIENILHLAITLITQKKWLEAEQMLQKSLSLREKEQQDLRGDSCTVSILDSLAVVHFSQEKWLEAEQMLRKSLSLRVEEQDSEYPNIRLLDTFVNLETFEALDCLAVALMNQNKWPEAEEILQKTLTTSEKVRGLEHPDTLVTLNRLGMALITQDKWPEAEEILQKILTTNEEIQGIEHPDTLDTLNGLGTVLMIQNKWPETEEILQKTLATIEKIRGPEHPDTLVTLDCLGMALIIQDKWPEAEEILRKALTTIEKIRGPEHPDTLVTLDRLGLTIMAQKKWPEAEQILRKALTTIEKIRGPEHPNVLVTLSRLVLVARGEYVGAEELSRKTLLLMQKVFGQGD